MEKKVDVEGGKSAYVAFSGDMEFIIISNFSHLLDVIDINLDNKEGEYSRSGNWQDDDGLNWGIQYSVEGKDSLIINEQSFYLSAGRIFVLKSDGSVVQLDDSEFEWGKDINVKKIRDFMVGKKREEKGSGVVFDGLKSD